MNISLKKHKHFRKLPNRKVDRKHLSTHITALKVIQDVLFIGEGNQVLLFDFKLNKYLKSQTVLKNSSVHGIRTDGYSSVLFFGSKNLKVYCFDKSVSRKCLKDISDEINLKDWIHDVQWITNENGASNKIAVISAHNCLLILDSIDFSCISSIHCAENCILYAGSIISCDEDAVIVAVGTVFKQILLWSPCHTGITNEARIPFHCLEGHQGVIFSISFSKVHKLLCSTSDDRSLRLWKIQSDPTVPEFSLEFWKKSSIHISHVLYAHESRVWASAILENHILSIGEDSHIYFWDLNGNLLKKKKCHKGGSVWCLETTKSSLSGINAVNSSVFDSYIGFTGGSDGGVYSWEIKNTNSDELVSELSYNTKFPLSDFPRITFLSSFKDRYLMVTTDKGWLCLYDEKLKNWHDLFYDDSFASYCASSVSFQRNCIALGNIHGEIVVFHIEKLFDKYGFKKQKIYEGKICSIHWIDKTEQFLLTCSIYGIMGLWKISYQNKEFQLQCIQELYLPKCKPHWWATAGLYLSVKNNVIVGDRGGSISLYSIVPNSNNCQVHPCMVHRYIHGDNGVTDIQEHNSFVYSSGRDGRVLLYSINNSSLNLLHSIKIPHDLEWIGKILFHGSNLLLLGFHTKYFMVWSTLLESAVMTVDCGGGHRSWDFLVDENGLATFVAIKKKKIMFCKQDIQYFLNRSVVKAGISGREFCHICYLFTTTCDSSGTMTVIASGGEDNALRILGIIDDPLMSTKVICLHSLSGHLSSIRSIAKTEMKEENSYLLISVGGRAQIKIWKIQRDFEVNCEEMASYILSSSDKLSAKPWKEKKAFNVDPQTRLMDVTICSLESKKYIIAVACSDSYIRVYSFDSDERQLTLCYNLQLDSYCIFKISSIQTVEKLDKNIFFVTGSTSGNIKVFSHKKYESLHDKSNISLDSKTELQPNSCFEVKVHKSGVNAIDVKQINDKMWLICSGGDDNTLSTVLVTFITSSTEEETIQVVAKAHVYNAHASQITGVQIIGSQTIVSASVDQRLITWQWLYEDNNIIIEQETSTLSLIPDISHLECWQNGLLEWTAVLCGEGIEIFSIKDE